MIETNRIVIQNGIHQQLMKDVVNNFDGYMQHYLRTYPVVNDKNPYYEFVEAIRIDMELKFPTIEDEGRLIQQWMEVKPQNHEEAFIKKAVNRMFSYSLSKLSRNN